MKLLVYGAGVIGCLYAALFSDAGHHVCIYARGQRTDVHMGHVHGFHGNKKMIAGIAGVLTAAYLLSGIYFVGLDETGVVRRFGAVVNEKVTPGIHYRLPAPFEEVSIIKSDNVQKIEVGV